MNCPKCRKKLDYEPMLSTPNSKSIKDKQLVYYCASCTTLYVFKEFTTKCTSGGTLVMSSRNIKRAGYYDINDRSYTPSGGYPSKPRIEQGSLVNLKKGQGK